jgi:hypothetical protein
MYARGGVRCFFVGSAATILRDLIFGGTFAATRHKPQRASGSSIADAGENTSGNHNPKKLAHTKKFIVNICAGSLATLLSSPLNYVRVIHYATPPDVPPQRALTILKALLASASAEPTLLKRFLYVQGRLRVGWGTARVGFGMAFSASLYDFCSKGTSSH